MFLLIPPFSRAFAFMIFCLGPQPFLDLGKLSVQARLHARNWNAATETPSLTQPTFRSLTEHGDVRLPRQSNNLPTSVMTEFDDSTGIGTGTRVCNAPGYLCFFLIVLSESDLLGES